MTTILSRSSIMSSRALHGVLISLHNRCLSVPVENACFFTHTWYSVGAHLNGLDPLLLPLLEYI